MPDGSRVHWKAPLPSWPPEASADLQVINSYEPLPRTQFGSGSGVLTGALSLCVICRSEGKYLSGSFAVIWRRERG